MYILDELNILERRILFQIGYGWKPYIGKIYYKINERNASLFGVGVSFCAKQLGPKEPPSFEIQMKFEMDFPEYRLFNIRRVYIPSKNQPFYTAHIYNNEIMGARADKINKMLVDHPDYELNNDFIVLM